MTTGNDMVDSVAYSLGTTMSFQDKWSRWHDKPCINGEPKSNNGWIYSAYADILGLPVNRVKLYECYNKSRANYPQTWPLHRSPGKGLPPMSRDEILGLDYFNMLWTTELEMIRHWQFCDLPGFKATPLWKMNWIIAIWCLLKMAFAQLVMKVWWNDNNEDDAPEWFRETAHRNAIWDESYKALWPLAFRLMPQDTWYMLKRGGWKVSWLHNQYAWWSMKRTIKRGDASGVLIVWLKLNKLGMTDHPLYQKIDLKKAVGEYFVENNPIRLKVESGR